MSKPVIMQIIEQMNNLPNNFQQQVLSFVLKLQQANLQESNNALDVLESLTGEVEAPADWSAEHDHYLYGTPKHQPTEL